MAQFTCESCSHTGRASDDHIGKSAKCPKCGVRGIIEEEPIPTIQVDRPPPRAEIQYPPTQFIPNQPARHPVWLSVMLAILFILLGSFSVLAYGMYTLDIGRATSAPQQAAGSGMHMAMAISAYIIARSIEKTLRAMAGV